MNVLSLFDGMSCGQIALNKLGIDYDKYFACEIDKYAMQVTQHNFPNTIQLGDVQFVTKETFGTHKIDLIMGGSPCQGFSFAGKQLNFDDPRSALFFEFVRLIKELKPKYFLLENVKMKKEYQDVISKYMGCEPVKINSALVSAQTRKRLYWTNIPGIVQPEDKGIVLKDIIEKGDSCDMVVKIGKELHKEDIDKSHCLLARDYKGFPNQPFTGVRIEQVDDKLRHPEATKKGYAEAGEDEGLDLTFPKSKTRRGRAMKDKSNCLTAASHEMGVVYNEEDIDNVDTGNKALDKTINKFSDSIDEEVILDSYNKSIHREKSPTITTRVSASNKTHVVKIDPSKPNQINPDKSAKSSSENEKGTQPHMQDRVFHEDGKSHALTSSFASRTKVGKFEEDKELRPATIVGRRLNERGVREDYNKDVPITQCLQVKHNSDKSGTLTTVDKDNVLSDNEPGRYPDAYNDKKLSWRKLTPLECERLQTVPDGYTLVMEDGKQKVSNSQRYKMLGNGWTVDVITHILKNMEL
jgi:site-specific DNA-cytosine methylase